MPHCVTHIRLRAATTKTITYAFVGADLLKTWGLDARAIPLANPLSADMAVMRTSLLPGLLHALLLNRNRQQERVRLFEVGKAFFSAASVGEPALEVVRIAGVVVGSAPAEQWGEKATRGFLRRERRRRVIVATVRKCLRNSTFQATAEDRWLHPGQSARLHRGDGVVGHLGALQPERARALGVEEDVYVFELDVAAIQPRPVPRAQPRFHGFRRSAAISRSRGFPETVSFAQIEACVRSAVGEGLAELLVFDQYSGENLGFGVKSLAIGLILQNSYRTLTDADADKSVTAAVAALTAECQAKLRG